MKWSVAKRLASERPTIIYLKKKVDSVFAAEAVPRFPQAADRGSWRPLVEWLICPKSTCSVYIINSNLAVPNLKARTAYSDILFLRKKRANPNLVPIQEIIHEGNGAAAHRQAAV